MISEVKPELDRLSVRIRALKNRLRKAREEFTATEVEIGELPNEFADLKTEIESWDDPPVGYFQNNATEEFVGMTAEFLALRDGAIAAKTDLAKRTEF